MESPGEQDTATYPGRPADCGAGSLRPFPPSVRGAGAAEQTPLLAVSSQGSLLEEDACRLGPRRGSELAREGREEMERWEPLG